MAVSDDLLIPLAGEWLSIAEVERRMREQGVSRFTLPGMHSREEKLAWLQMRASKYFLVRNRGVERWRCADPRGHQCGGLHEYFTFMGIDRPWRGLEHALWGYAQVTRDDGLSTKLLRWAPHLDAGHPALAHQIAPKEPGSELVAVALGVLEPISQLRADALVRRINSLIKSPNDRLIL